jgi:Flp pilus assembly protein TadD
MRRRLAALVVMAVFLGGLAGLAFSQESLSKLYKKILPAVVTVIAYDEDGQAFSQGSGFFINREAHMITNRHVLKRASWAEVKTSDGQRYPIKHPLCEDVGADLIKVQVNMPNRESPFLPVSGELPEVGDQVIVIGSPRGLEATLTEGIVSGYRQVDDFKLIQISAAISPGSSGGPVFNLKGEVVGVATLTRTDAQNISFAVPGSRVVALIESPNKPTRIRFKDSATSDLAGPEKPSKASPEKAVKPPPEAKPPEPPVAKVPIPEPTPAPKKEVPQPPKMVSAKDIFAQGMKYFQEENFEKAAQAFKEAARLQKDWTTAWYNLGLSYSRLRRMTEAEEAYKVALRLNPKYSEAHNNLGTIYDKIGRRKDALECFKKAVTAKPENAEANYNLGGSYYQLNRFQEAIEPYRQAVRLKPDWARAHYGLALAYLKIGVRGLALEEYNKLVALDPQLAKELFKKIYD